jgi:ABC-type transporter Mla subunit MlaD
MNEAAEEPRINAMLRSLEEKFVRSILEMKNKYDLKCEQYDKTIAEISKELITTKRMLNEHHSKLRTVVDTKLGQSESISSGSFDGNEDLPQTLHFDKDRLRKNQNADSDGNTADVISSVVEHPSNHSEEHLSSFGDTTVTTTSIEGLIRKELRSYMKEVLAERETQIYLLHLEIEKQNQQIAQLRIDVLSRLRVFEFYQLPQEPGPPIPLHCMKFEGTEVEIELIEDDTLPRSITSKVTNSLATEQQLALVHKDDPLIQLTSQVCNSMIMLEGEHMMKIWGTLFDDLTIYLQDNLDKQRECIAEVQKSTFEHVDAERQTQLGVLKAQMNYLTRKNQQQENAIQELRDEQERSFLVVVETLIKLKSKFQGISDQIKQQEEMHLSSEINVATLRQKVIDELNSWTSKFNEHEKQIQQLSGNVGVVVEDRDSLQTVLSAVVELFNEKMESSSSSLHEQLTALEDRLTRHIEAGQTEFQKINNHKRDIDIVVTAICKKLVDLSADKGINSRTEVEYMLSCKNVDGSNDDCKCIKANPKKYKNALWSAQKQRTGNNLFKQPEIQKEIEFYDLTLAESKSSK